MTEKKRCSRAGASLLVFFLFSRRLKELGSLIKSYLLIYVERKVV
jgi:hypothetical protein